MKNWEKDIREKKGVHSLGTRKSSSFDKGARLFEIILSRAGSKAIQHKNRTRISSITKKVTFRTFHCRLNPIQNKSKLGGLGLTSPRLLERPIGPIHATKDMICSLMVVTGFQRWPMIPRFGA